MVTLHARVILQGNLIGYYPACEMRLPKWHQRVILLARVILHGYMTEYYYARDMLSTNGISDTQSNFNSSNTDGSFTVANSNFDYTQQNSSDSLRKQNIKDIEDIYSFALNTINIVIEWNENISIFTRAKYEWKFECFHYTRWKFLWYSLKKNKFSFLFYCLHVNVCFWRHK